MTSQANSSAAPRAMAPRNRPANTLSPAFGTTRTTTYPTPSTAAAAATWIPANKALTARKSLTLTREFYL